MPAYCHTISYVGISQLKPCADPGLFLVYKRRDDLNTTKPDHHRPAYEWRFAGVPMMAQHWMLA